MTKKELVPFFRETIPDGWLYSLGVGNNTIYNGDTLLSWYMLKDICIINSISVKDKRFCKEILRDINFLIETNNKVAISSTVESIERYLKKRNFSYNRDNKTYTKGI